MKKRWVILCCLVSLIAGAGAASWYLLWFNGEFLKFGFASRTNAEIVTKVAVLELLRAGRNADATNLLEVLLDGDLIGASVVVRDGGKLTDNALRALVKERQGRAVTGYEPSDQNVRETVHAVLFRLTPEGNRK